MNWRGTSSKQEFCSADKFSRCSLTNKWPSDQDPQKQKASEHLRLEAFAATGAGERNRTLDLLITSELLYQLSYSGNLLLASVSKN